MKSFIRKISLFVLIPFSLVSAYLLSLNNFVDVAYKIPADIHTIFIGDSHIQTAVNDSFIPGSVNLANHSESPYFTYYKLKTILDHNSGIQHVVLGCAEHTISDYYEAFLNGQYAAKVAPKYFYTLPPEQQIRQMFWNTQDYRGFMLSISEFALNNDTVTVPYPFIGGYRARYRLFKQETITKLMNKRWKQQFYNLDEDKDTASVRSFSPTGISYLRKTIQLCKERDIKITLLNTPTHPFYREHIPADFTDKLNQIIKEEDVEMINASNFELAAHQYYVDGDHLCNDGPNVFSTYLSRKLEE